MARKSRNGPQLGWVAMAAALILVAFVGAAFFISSDATPYRTTPQLDVGAYLDNANSLRGNVYRIEGEILNSLAWSPSEGRLISIGVEEGRNVLPVLVTRDFNEINIQKGQKFIFLLEVDEEGILRTKSLTKS